MAGIKSFITEVAKKTKITTNLNSSCILLQINKIHFTLDDCSEIWYSIGDSYPRRRFCKPWFNSSELQQENERFLFVGIEISRSHPWTLDSFVDVFVSVDKLIRFSVIKARVLPATQHVMTSTFQEKKPKHPGIMKAIRNSLLTSNKICQYSDNDELVANFQYEINPGLSRVAFGCRPLKEEGDYHKFLFSGSLSSKLVNTNAFLNYQMQIIELSNLQLFFNNSEINSVPNKSATLLGRLVEHDDIFFLGPLFFIWFMKQTNLKEPKHDLEKRLTINKWVKEIIDNPEITLTGVYEKGHFHLKKNSLDSSSGILVARHLGAIVVSCNGELLPWVYVEKILSTISDSCHYISRFLGWTT